MSVTKEQTGAGDSQVRSYIWKNNYMDGHPDDWSEYVTLTDDIKEIFTKDEVSHLIDESWVAGDIPFWITSHRRLPVGSGKGLFCLIGRELMDKHAEVDVSTLVGKLQMIRFVLDAIGKYLGITPKEMHLHMPGTNSPDVNWVVGVEAKEEV